MSKNSIKIIILAAGFFVLFLFSFFGGALADRLFVIKPLDYITKRVTQPTSSNISLTNEESSTIDVVDKASPAVVTVSIETPQRRVLQFNPFQGFTQQVQGGEPQDIGSGFIVDNEGIVITNKHVVDNDGTYKVVTQDGEEHEVKEIIKDPSNDLAILKVDGIDKYQGLELGESNSLKVGQSVIAIGTALGEFRHTVTTGVVSGLGRGIVAGSVYQGYTERLDDLIQTDAAINPGNSGGPLLNSSGQVIGINVAVSQGAQNIGFALPVDLVKEGLKSFSETGNFASKPFLGVEHSIITRESALLNEVPQGAYVISVVSGSAADQAGIKEGDIITKINSESVSDQDDGLSGLIAKYKVGQQVSIEVYREDESGNGKTLTLKASLSASENQAK